MELAREAVFRRSGPRGTLARSAAGCPEGGYCLGGVGRFVPSAVLDLDQERRTAAQAVSSWMRSPAAAIALEAMRCSRPVVIAADQLTPLPGCLHATLLLRLDQGIDQACPWRDVPGER